MGNNCVASSTIRKMKAYHMRNYLFIILFLIYVPAYGESRIAKNQDVYEKAYHIARKSESSILLEQLLKIPRDNSNHILINNFSVYKQLADKLLEFSIKAPLTSEDYALLREFARVYPISEKKTFIEALTYYINNDWEKSEKILNSLQHNGEKRLGVFLLLGNMAAYSGQKDSWMFNKVLLENPFGTIDFLDFSGVIVPPQIEKQNSCRWAINLFGIIEENKELQQNKYIQMKLRYIANQVFQGVEKIYIRKNVSQAEVESVLQKIIFHIQKQKLFLAIDNVLLNVTYKLKYELKGTTLMAYLEIQKCDPSSEEFKKIILEKEQFII